MKHTPMLLTGLVVLTLALSLGCTLVDLLATEEPPVSTKTPMDITSVPEEITPSPSPMPMCTPPACTDEEVYYCPGECPGGCGTECATPTPSPTPESTALRIAYISGGNLWVLEEGGSPQQLTTTGTDSRPLLSPDGQRILFERELSPGPGDVPRFELRVINVDGSGERPVAGPDDLPGEMGTPVGSETETMLPRLPWQVAWHPDGQRVAFNTLIQVGYGLYAKHDLWIADPDAGTVTRLLDDDAGGAFAFAPDGSTVMVADPTTVARANGDGSDREELITFDFVNTGSEYAYVPQPVWMPDSSHALIAISSAEPFGPNPSGNIWRIPRAGDALQLATLSGRFLFSTMGENNLWSPDRSRFAYINADEDLIHTNGDGSDRSVYASGSVEFVGWSPDSQRFIYKQGSPWTYYVGEMGADPIALLPPDLSLQVQSAEWIAPNTFVYSSGTKREAVDVRLGEVTGAHRVLVTGVQMFDVDGRP